jgi:hypothetical protein
VVIKLFPFSSQKCSYCKGVWVWKFHTGKDMRRENDIYIVSPSLKISRLETMLDDDIINE